jgi:hypothetical protein
MVIGGVILIVLIIYAWNFKKDGLFHHNLFLHRNFVISLVALAIEGMSYMAAGIYFPASLSVVQSGKMDGYRQSLCYMVGFCAFAVVTLATGHYVSKTKTVQVTGGPAFVAIMIFFILMATVTASTPEASFWGYICFFWTILGLAFVSFFTVAQFATGPELIAVTIGPAVSIRSFGGSVGLANFNALAANGYSKEVVLKVTAAVVALGLPSQRIAPLIAGLSASNMTLVNSIPDVTTGIIEAAGLAMKEARLIGYRDVFICGAAFSLVAAIGESQASNSNICGLIAI